MKIRKAKEVYAIYKNEFEKNPYWDRELMNKLAIELNQSPQAVYKWNWDQRKKRGIPSKRDL